MCWQCRQIEQEIEHYRGLCDRVNNEGSAKSLGILIERLEAEKRDLHILELNLPAKTSPRC